MTRREHYVHAYIEERRLSDAPLKKLLGNPTLNVYLAGPINGCEKDQSYRTEITEKLKQIIPQITILDPWVTECELRQIVYAPDVKSDDRSELAEQIIINDLDAINDADFVLAYVNRLSVGTSMEMFYTSRILNKPVLLIYTLPEKIPVWLLGHANKVFGNITETMDWISKEASL